MAFPAFTIPRFLVVCGMTSVLSVAHAGAVCDQPMELPNQPQLSDYDDYGAFVVDIMNYKKQEEEKNQHRQDCPELYRQAPVITYTGPEDLDEAVANVNEPARLARQMITASDRSSATDFPLEQQPGDALSGLFLGTSLDMLDPHAQMTPDELTRFLSFINALVDDPQADITDPERRRDLFPDGSDLDLDPLAPFIGPLQLVGVEVGDRITVLLRADGSSSNQVMSVTQSCMSSCAGQ